MKENKSITLEVDNAEIEAFEKLVENGLQSAPDDITTLKAMSLLTNIRQAYETGKAVGSLDKSKRILSKVKEVEYLNKVIERQRWRISGLMAVPLLQGTLNIFTGANNTAAVMDLLNDPDEVEVHCTKDHTGEDFEFRPRNILAIEGDKKKKTIYFRKPVQPKQGGTKRHHIELSIDFEDLLKIINEKSKTLYRIHNSFAINIFEYSFSKPNMFVLIDKPKHELYTSILEKSTDSKFDTEEYFKRISEMELYKNYLTDFQSNLKKMELITAQIDYFKKAYGSKVEDTF